MCLWLRGLRRVGVAGDCQRYGLVSTAFCLSCLYGVSVVVGLAKCQIRDKFLISGRVTRAGNTTCLLDEFIETSHTWQDQKLEVHVCGFEVCGESVLSEIVNATAW